MVNLWIQFKSIQSYGSDLLYAFSLGSAYIFADCRSAIQKD